MAKFVKLHPAFAASGDNKVTVPKSLCGGGNNKLKSGWQAVPGQVSEAVFQKDGKITQRLA